MSPLSLHGEVLLVFQLPGHLPVPCGEVIGEGMETGIVPFIVIKASLPSAWGET